MLLGGDRQGSILAPAVIADVDPSSPFSKDELFGPAVAVNTATSRDEAIALANDTIYGLSVGVFTSDLAGAVRAERHEAFGLDRICLTEEGGIRHAPADPLRFCREVLPLLT